MKKTLLLALLCAAATLLFATAAMAQESGTGQYSESGYCEKRIGTKDEPFASPSYKGESEYDAINACIDARRQEEAADPAPCSEVIENSYRFSVDRVEDCQGQYADEPDVTEQEDDIRVDDPDAYSCSEILGSPAGATGIASNGTLRRFGEERVAGCTAQLEAEIASPDPCAGPLFEDTFGGLSTEYLADSSGNLADPALVDPDGNGVICDSTEPADQGQYEEPGVESPEAVSCAEVLGPRPGPKTQGLVQEADLVAPGQKELYGEERVQECLDQLRVETAVFADPTSEDYSVCSQPLFAELYTGLSTEYLYALGGADVRNERPADPDGNGIICDSMEPAAPVQPEPEERAQAPDPCAELSFAKRYAGRPVAEAPNPEDPVIDPDGTGVVCGHVLVKHGHVPFEGEPETGKVLPRTGGLAVALLVGSLLGFGILGAVALRTVARGR